MKLRYCPRCRAEVEDADGFCLLGHPLPVANEDPIADLRAEVHRAFKQVQVDISEVFEEKLDEPVPEPAAGVYAQLKSDADVAEEIVESRRDVWRALEDDDPVERDDPILSFSPSPRMEWGARKLRGRKRDRS